MQNAIDIARRKSEQSAVAQAAFAFLGEVPAERSPFPAMQIDAECLRNAIARWTGRGHAISFGLSGDQGAFGIHLIAGGQKVSKWFGHVAEAEDFLTTLPGPNALPVGPRSGPAA